MNLLKDITIGILLGALFAVPMYVALIRQEQIEQRVEVVKNGH
jgi:type III secretory pathway component EscT